MENEHSKKKTRRARKKVLANELNAFKRIFFEENGRKPAQVDYETSADIATKLTEFIRLDGKAVVSSASSTSKNAGQEGEATPHVPVPPMMSPPTFNDDDTAQEDSRSIIIADDDNNYTDTPPPPAAPVPTLEGQGPKKNEKSSSPSPSSVPTEASPLISAVLPTSTSMSATWIRSLDRHHVYDVCPVTRWRSQLIVRGAHNTHAKFAAFIALHFPDFSPLGGNRQDLAVVCCAALSICYGSPFSTLPALRNELQPFDLADSVRRHPFVPFHLLPRDILEHTLAVLCVPPTARTDEEYLRLQSQSVDRVVAPSAHHMVMPHLQFVCRLQFNGADTLDRPFLIPFDRPEEIHYVGRNHWGASHRLGGAHVKIPRAYRRLRLEVDLSRLSQHQGNGTAQQTFFSGDSFLRELTDIDRDDDNAYDHADNKSHKRRSLKSVLSRIILPDTLVDTGNSGFLSRCPVLKQLHIAHLSQLTRIGDAFLKDCVSLRSIQLPSSIVEIGRHFMAACLAVSYVDLRNAFRLTRVGDFFLDNCIRLQRVELPPCVTAVGHRFLNGCHAIAALDISNTYPALTRLGDGFLNSCHKILTVKLPPSVSTIGHQFMSFCTEVKEVDLQSLPLTRIADGFLNNCHNLARADLPTTLSEVGHRFINCCSSIEDVDLSALPNLVRVGDLCLNNCHSLARLKLPMSLAEVGHHFLNCCTQLEEVDLTDMPVKVMGDDCFSGCRSLIRIQLPVSLVHVGHQFLGGCSAIEELDFHTTRQLVRIGNGFLRNCVRLRSLQGLDLRKLHRVGVDFLRGCRSLKGRKMLQTSVLRKVSSPTSSGDAEKQSQMEARKQQQQKQNQTSEQRKVHAAAREAVTAEEVRTTDEVARPSSPPAPPAWVMLRQHGLVAQRIHLSLLAVLEAIIDALDVVPLVPAMSSSPADDAVAAAGWLCSSRQSYIGDSGIGIGNGNQSRRRCRQRHNRSGCIQATTTTTITTEGRNTTTAIAITAVAEDTSIRPIHTTPKTKTAAVGQQVKYGKHSTNGKRGFFEFNQRASQLRETTRAKLLSVKLAHEVHAKQIVQQWMRPIEGGPSVVYKVQQNIARTLQLLFVGYDGASAVIWRALLQILSTVGTSCRAAVVAMNDEGTSFHVDTTVNKEMAAVGPRLVTARPIGPNVRSERAQALLQQTLKYAATTRRLAEALDTVVSSSSNFLQPWLSGSGTPFSSFLFPTNNSEEEEEDDEDNNDDTNIPSLILKSVKVLRHVASQFRNILTHRTCPPAVECDDDDEDEADAIKCCLLLADRLEQLAACLAFAVAPASTDGAAADTAQQTTSDRSDEDGSEGNNIGRSADDESAACEEDRCDKAVIEEGNEGGEDENGVSTDVSSENNDDIDVEDYDWYLAVADRWLAKW